MWQVQEAKQPFSDLVRRTGIGDQIVTRHGEPVAVVVSYDRYRKLVDEEDTGFKELLRAVSEFGDPPWRDRPRPVVDL